MTAYELLTRQVPEGGMTLPWQLANGAMAGLIAQTCEWAVSRRGVG